MRTRKTMAAAAALFALAAGAWAQEGDAAFDEDALFGSDEFLVESVPESESGDAFGTLLVTEAVRIGGSFSGSLDPYWKWNDPWSGFSLDAPDSYALEPSAALTAFFDARPTEDARFYGSVKMAWPFETVQRVVADTEYIPAPDVINSYTDITSLNIKVFELFSDFSWNDALFLRFGKQTVSWGVGYFFSPADVLNLQAIDPLDPTAQREGPVTLRAHYPIPGSQHNLYAYAVFDSADMKPEDIAVAAKAEFALGGWELGTGAWYRRDRPLRGMVTAVGSWDRISLFGEATLSRGSDKSWVTDVNAATPGFVTLRTDDTSPFFKGTAGFLWSQSDWNLTLAGQYLYDGEGYADADREAQIADAHSQEAAIKAALTLAGVPDVDAAFSGFLKGLILGSGRHYAALSLSKGELFFEDLSGSIFAMGNLSDLSGFARLSLSWRLFKGLTASAGATFAFGATDSEYLVLNDGPSMALSLGLSLGSGSF